VPTGSASPDYFGGKRPGNDLYADSLVVLRAQTGKMVWHFQTVHHDLWDYDVASQPLLFTMKRNGREIPAVAAGSKTGHLFMFQRETGKPLFPIEERPVPASDVPGEHASPTQPVPAMPKPLVPQTLNAANAWGANEADRTWCQDTIRGLRADGLFTPPSVKGSLQFPGNVGGMAWGGATFDPPHGLIIVPTNRLASIARLIPRQEYEKEAKSPHGDWEFAEQNGTPYGMARRFFRNPRGLPCNAPPWGALTAIDAATGAVKWEVPFGSLPGAGGDAAAEKLGSVNLGGAIATGGGLVFIGATLDAHLRAFDVLTGDELWKGELPAAARATPMTYRAANGKQYVVIAAGGFDLPGLPLSDTLVAFALP
ncbi:MAG: PQQ-binding-like beta-propeller repeat protein, partial [Bryobacteraceae bacterium]